MLRAVVFPTLPRTERVLETGSGPETPSCLLRIAPAQAVRHENLHHRSRAEQKMRCGSAPQEYIEHGAFPSRNSTLPGMAIHLQSAANDRAGQALCAARPATSTSPRWESGFRSEPYRGLRANLFAPVRGPS